MYGVHFEGRGVWLSKNEILLDVGRGGGQGLDLCHEQASC